MSPRKRSSLAAVLVAEIVVAWACSSTPSAPHKQAAAQKALNETAEGAKTAAENAAFELLNAIAQGRTQDAIRMLENGADPNARLPGSRPDNGPTALIVAASQGDEQVVKALLKRHARIQATDSRGSTALMAAASAGAQRVAQLLLAAGADVQPMDQLGYNALCLAVVAGHEGLVHDLLSAGARADVGAKQDGSPIGLAVESGIPGIAQKLLAAGAPVDTPNPSVGGMTPLMNAANRGDEAITRILLRAGAGVNARDQTRRTPLMYAAASNHLNTAALLLKAGADPSLRDQSGQSAADLARANGNIDVATLLDRSSPQPQQAVS